MAGSCKRVTLTAMPKQPKLSPYAKRLVREKFYPKQVTIMRGHVRNPNAAVYAMVRNQG